jgi:hypothetical protein
VQNTSTPYCCWPIVPFLLLDLWLIHLHTGYFGVPYLWLDVHYFEDRPNMGSI